MIIATRSVENLQIIEYGRLYPNRQILISTVVNFKIAVLQHKWKHRMHLKNNINEF